MQELLPLVAASVRSDTTTAVITAAVFAGLLVLALRRRK